jgi:dTDP-4-dehydrorhamnose reductase
MADAKPCPQTEYARLKRDAEAAIMKATDGRAAVLRLTKVLGPGHPLVADWRASLAAGRTVAAFADAAVAPVGLSQAVDAALKLLLSKKGGILHFSASRDTTWLELARAVARRCRAEESLVQPASAADRGLPAPRFAALGMGPREEGVGLLAADSDEALAEALS